MKIEVFLLEHGNEELKLSLGVYEAKSIWEATEKAKKRYAAMFHRLVTQRFYTEARAAYDVPPHVPKKRLRDTTPDIFEL